MSYDTLVYLAKTLGLIWMMGIFVIVIILNGGITALILFRLWLLRRIA